MVTGGAGFIGSHLVDQLVTYGAQVTVLDNLSTGNKDNLAQSINHITFIKGDIRNAQTCLQASKACDTVFHLAACVSVPQSMQDPQFCYDVNIQGTQNLLEASRSNNIKRFVFSSSCAVYGEKNRPCSEADTCNPTSPYAYSKYIGELLCQQYAKVFGVSSICLRYFNVIGTRQNPYGPYAGVYAKFSDHMYNNQPITIYGDGSQTRDFIPVEEVVKANLQLALLPHTHYNGKAINIATGTGTTILQIFKRLQSIHPSYAIPPIFVPERTGDIFYSCADIKLYKNLYEQID